MATDLTTRTASLQAILSSTDCVAWRRISLGTINHPGLPTRRYLAGGLKLTDEQRARIKAKADELEAFTVCQKTREEREGMLALISKMLMAYPMAGSSAEMGIARGEAYLSALDDVPPWAIAEAIRNWHRGKGGSSDSNYRFAPAPAELRHASMQVLQPAQQASAHLKAVLTALTIERAMDPTPVMSEIPTQRQPKLRIVP